MIRLKDIKLKITSIDYKLIILVLVFAGAVFIDLARHNGNGTLWRNANYCIGIVVAIISLCFAQISKKRMIVYAIVSLLTIVLMCMVPLKKSRSGYFGMRD